MGKSRSYEIIEYRKIIMNELCKSKEIIKLFGLENEKYPEDIIPYQYSYPHEHVPDTITETERYINFEISANLYNTNRTFNDLKVYFFVFCHQDVIRYLDKGREYLWYDKVTCELDTIFGGKYIMGVGKTELISNKPYSPENTFKGRLLTFDVKDFTDGKKLGK